jgi:EAL domain-containing protein (putative c-di-GMP-specific phosphodiesterase class I)
VQAIADGVETQEQVEMLKKLGCDYAQGNYYDLPMSVRDFESKYIKTN